MLTSAQFARLASVSRAAVCKGIKDGRIIETPQKLIDETDPKNVEYISNKTISKNAILPKSEPQKKHAETKARIEKKPAEKPRENQIPKSKKAKTTLDHMDGLELPTDGIDDDDIKYPDALDKLNVDIRLKKAQAMRHELKFYQDKKELVDISEVRKIAQKIQVEIKSRIQDMPKRISPRIVALAESGNGAKIIEIELQKEIDEAIESIRKVFEKQI